MERLAELKSEVNKTLYFLAQMDLQIYGYITKETVNAFSVQKCEFPEMLKEYCK